MPERWSDYSEIQRWREQGKDHEAVLHQRKINALRAETGLSREEACRKLDHEDGVEIPDWRVDGRPAALQPEVAAGD